MCMERSVISELLAKYDTTFKLSEVEALVNGESLPSNASPTLLDIEQSLRPWGEEIGVKLGPPSDNVE
jgi:hypothetical protein